MGCSRLSQEERRVIEQQIEISTPDGVIDGLFLRPESSGAWPGVLMLPDIGGPRVSMHEMAQRLAAEGFCVLLPNPFYRTGKPPLFTFKLNFAEEQTLKRFAELASPLTPDAIERDAAMYTDFLSAQPWVKSGKLGVVGYCFTGGMALRIAAARSDQVGAVASFHGGGLCTDAPTSPHLVLPRVKARLYFAHADKDRSMSAEAIDRLGGALQRWGGRYESVVFDGSLHGWTVPDSSVYDQEAAERAFRALILLFKEELGVG
jgi:carboxymethylenebutenolidase